MTGLTTSYDNTVVTSPSSFASDGYEGLLKDKDNYLGVLMKWV